MKVGENVCPKLRLGINLLDDTLRRDSLEKTPRRGRIFLNLRVPVNIIVSNRVHQLCEITLYKEIWK
jgi:hypothetical protein